jgi:hypothetical protein
MYEYRKTDPDYESKKVRNSKLSKSQVIELRERLKGSKKGMRTKLAKEFKISLTQLKRIENGDNWKHI